MRRWFAFYQEAIKTQPELFYQAGKISQIPDLFTMVPWRHHTDIISECKSVEEALFYIHKTVDNNWSRSVLESNLNTDLYKIQGKAITNFSSKLPLPQSSLAQNILKDPYNFSFLNMQRGYDERKLEDALVNNITRFLLELGKGFAFVGRQTELKMPNGKSYFPDLIFYHTFLKCYVVIELKVVDFIPEFVGKLNFYVSAADELLKQSDDKVQRQLGLVPSIVTKESKGEYIQALIDSRESEDCTIIQDVMMAQHIANLEGRVLQYQKSTGDTVNDTAGDTVKANDTTSRLISAIKEHPEYTYDKYAQVMGVGRATVARYIKKLNGTVIHRIGSDKDGHWELIKEKDCHD